MLVVLAIIALAASALPVLGAGLPGVRLRAEADRIAATLRDLRERAIRDDRSTEFVVDPAARTYAASGDSHPRHLPAAVAIALDPAIAAPIADAARIRFFADGTATGGTVVLSGAHRTARVVVDWLSGAVHRR